MKRDKKWWRALTEVERIRLHWLERAERKCGRSSPYYPDDMVECPDCGNPSGSGLCVFCSAELDRILAKGDGIRKYGKTRYSTGLIPQFTTERRERSFKPVFAHPGMFWVKRDFDRHFQEAP